MVSDHADPKAAIVPNEERQWRREKIGQSDLEVGRVLALRQRLSRIFREEPVMAMAIRTTCERGKICRGGTS